MPNYKLSCNITFKIKEETKQCFRYSVIRRCVYILTASFLLLSICLLHVSSTGGYIAVFSSRQVVSSDVVKRK
jgi:hypothetical protein